MTFRTKQLLALLLTFIAIMVFIISCAITLSDGQGALVFIFTIPLMTVLLFIAVRIIREKKLGSSFIRLDFFPKLVAGFLILFFISAFIPTARVFPDFIMKTVEKMFVVATEKTPYVFFKDRSSLASRLSKALEKNNNKVIFSELDVTFAWDTVCVFGPYTNNEKAQSILNLNWKIQEFSQIHYLDSINALIFLYEGKVNKIVDLKRSIVDFINPDFCISKNEAVFLVEIDAHGHKKLKLIQ